MALNASSGIFSKSPTDFKCFFAPFKVFLSQTKIALSNSWMIYNAQNSFHCKYLDLVQNICQRAEGQDIDFETCSSQEYSNHYKMIPLTNLNNFTYCYRINFYLFWILLPIVQNLMIFESQNFMDWENAPMFIQWSSWFRDSNERKYLIVKKVILIIQIFWNDKSQQDFITLERRLEISVALEMDFSNVNRERACKSWE